MLHTHIYKYIEYIYSTNLFCKYQLRMLLFYRAFYQGNPLVQIKST